MKVDTESFPDALAGQQKIKHNQIMGKHTTLRLALTMKDIYFDTK